MDYGEKKAFSSGLIPHTPQNRSLKPCNSLDMKMMFDEMEYNS